MEEFKDKLLSRVDFSILITVTAALCSVWRIIGTETLDGGILAGAYFFMGLFLCFIKCKEIFGSIEPYKKLSENTAYVFFNSWFYVLIIYFLSHAIQEILPAYCWLIIFFVFFTVGYVLLEKKHLSISALAKFLSSFAVWYFVSMIITVVLSFNVNVTLDKDWYERTDDVYVTMEANSYFSEEVPAIFIDSEGNEIEGVCHVTGNTYLLPASEMFGKDVYAVYSYPLKLNKERILRTPNLKKISYKARINKLNLNIRY